MHRQADHKILNSADDKMITASGFGDVFYGFHFAEGLAEYRDGDTPFRLFINESTAKEMDPTFPGRPVYLLHVDEVVVSELGNGKEDGWVAESFFNKSDGRHWVKFIVISDRAKEAIRTKKWKLSNAYKVKEFRGAGQWHGIDYQKEVARAEYEHLAIVPNPRYDEPGMGILTPDEFKAYNAEKELDLARLTNAKEEKVSMFKFFNQKPVENAADLESMVVELPKAKKKVSLADIINDADMAMMSGGYANGDHKVKVGEEEMTVNELVDRHMKLKSSMAEGEKLKENDDSEADMDAKKAEKMGEGEGPAAKNDEDEEMEKKEKSKEKKDDTKKNAKTGDRAHFDKLKNAHETTQNAEVVELSLDKMARGKSRYGSN